MAQPRPLPPSGRSVLLACTPFACVLAALLACRPGSTLAAGAAAPRAYVQSGPDGVFYARCVPPAGGRAGHTDVYRVEGETDARVDRYDWFAPGGLVLGWSPTRGEVAVMAAMQGQADDGDWRRQEELRLCIGGRVLKSYTSGDLLDLGAEEQVRTEPRRRQAACRLVGCEQVPGTNEYDFVVEVGRHKRLRFDITTGEPRRPEAGSRAGADVKESVSAPDRGSRPGSEGPGVRGGEVDLDLKAEAVRDEQARRLVGTDVAKAETRMTR